MDQNLFKTIAIGVTLWVGGCASTPSNILSDRVGSIIEVTELKANAPNGVKAFCLEHKDQCGESLFEDRGARVEKVRVSTGGTSEQVELNAKDMFQAMMQQRLDDLKIKVETSQDLVPAGIVPQTTKIKMQHISVNEEGLATRPNAKAKDLFQGMMQQRLDELKRLDSQPQNVSREVMTAHLAKALFKVNANINKRIWPSTDTITYGADDKWAMPLTYPGQDVGARGDCEDYVLEKRRKLELLGVDRKSLPIAVVKNTRVGIHAVLLVRTSQGDIVLDNLNSNPVFVDETDYEFVALQASSSLHDWSVAKRGKLAALPIEDDAGVGANSTQRGMQAISRGNEEIAGVGAEQSGLSHKETISRAEDFFRNGIEVRPVDIVRYLSRPVSSIVSVEPFWGMLSESVSAVGDV
ncbi:transglutaminase-like cysteine peptidase [Hirschia litorea]|uniref:Transglutaminase-like cysteine peptidase n=1 Tax=Hirschia litorea TaxID=1199156 RepID=A0ABW2IQ06_9PROT